MRAAGWLGVVVSCVLATGCVEPSITVCGDRVCPADSTCEVATGLCVPLDCGNNEISGAEECDGTDLGGRDCRFYGYYTAGTLTCSSVCRYEEESCADAQICGDHVVNGEEHCDGAPYVDETCIDYGFDIGTISCTEACSPGFATCQDVGWRVVGGDRLTPMQAIWGASATDVFVGGADGRILRGSGTTWTVMANPTTTSVLGIWGTSSSNVWAVGGIGTILHFDGTAWTQVTSPTTFALTAIWGRSANDIYAVGDEATIIHYDGATWSLDNPTLNGGPLLRGVWGDSDTVIAIGERGIGNARIYRREGTNAWSNDTAQAPALGYTYELNAIWGVENNFFVVGGETLNGRNVILRYNSTDGWTGESTGTSDLDSIWGSSPSNVIAGGHTGVMWRFDGSQWRRVFVDTNRSITGIWGADPRSVYASSAAGTVLAPDGYEWRRIDNVASPTLDLRGIARFPGGELILVGQGGQVIDVVDGVATQAVLLPTPTQVPVVQGIWDSGGAYGTTTTVLTTTRGIYVRKPSETAFTRQSLPGLPDETGTFESAHGTSATNVYATGVVLGASFERFVLKYDGNTWTKLTLPTLIDSARLTGIYAASPTDIHVVGLDGTLLHSADGATFTATPLATTIQLRALWGSSANDIFAVGGQGTVMHYDGTSWRTQSLRSADILTTVIGTSPHNVFAGGAGAFWHYDGTRWTKQALPISFNVTGAATDQDSVTFTGILGTVLAFEHTCDAAEQGDACGDSWDNDCDGKINCADDQCAGTIACVTGGVCEVAAELACNQTLAGTSFSGIARVHDVACFDAPSYGTEVTYRLAAPASGNVTITLEGDDVGSVRLAIADAAAVTSACDLTTCTAATGASITVPAAGEPLYIYVDAPVGTGADFTIRTDCN